MSLKDFVYYYNDVGICMYEDDYNYANCKVDGSATTHDFVVDIPEDGDHYICALQTSRRSYPRNANYSYSLTTL